jgi:hypothetical protein
VRTEFLRHPDGGATYAAQCASNDGTLAKLNLASLNDELFTGVEHHRKCCGLDWIKALWKLRQAREISQKELGVGLASAAEDLVALGIAFDAFADRANDAGTVVTEDSGQFQRHESLHGSTANLPIDGIDSGCDDANEDLAVTRLGIVSLLILQLSGSAVFV